MRSAIDYSASRNLDPSELENAAGGSTKKVSIESGRDNGKEYRDEHQFPFPAVFRKERCFCGKGAVNEKCP